MATADLETLADSRAGTLQPESTAPSTPLTATELDDSKEDKLKEELSDSEDVDGMDSKATALMHLLKTSSVCIYQRKLHLISTI